MEAQDTANNTQTELRWGSSNLSCNDDLQAAQNSKTFADAQAHLKLKRAEPKTKLYETTQKRSGSTSSEMDAPPKRLNLGPLKGWGIEKDGISMSVVEYAQNVSNNAGKGHSSSNPAPGTIYT
ncbi:hypothetical protein B0H13DRAFT_2270499 [Mycena leptocephala]|nr:hypothetical protein B0H13DRAFT_2281817 [Mycena leptocephala]KAJ7915148.1 hypothetical protein B0H13DRAFT_2270499 [Mycena leptocephala]